jgi:hypothetical protein
VAKTTTAEDIPVVGPRAPCPCGSGKRYKACHGKRVRARYVPRPFEGLANEGDWIALREIVACATAPLKLAGDPDRDVLAVTLLPQAQPALVRDTGQVLLALQTPTSTGDPSADLAHALSAALEAEPGTPVSPGARAENGPRLQDVLDVSAPLDVTVHEGFGFWFDSDEDVSPEVGAALEQANEAAPPAARLSSVDAAYWVRYGDRDQLRWVMPFDEEPLLDGLSRLHAADEDGLGEQTRLLGTFRAHGRLVPVWDLAPGTAVGDVEDPAAALAERLAAAMKGKKPLTAAERRARAGLANRQITIR